MYVCDVVDVTGIIPLFVYSQSSWRIVRTERDDSLLLSTKYGDHPLTVTHIGASCEGSNIQYTSNTT